MTKLRYILICACLLVFGTLPAAAAQGGSGETVDVKGIVFGHIGDSYEWHITSWNGRELFPEFIVFPTKSPKSKDWFSSSLSIVLCISPDDISSIMPLYNSSSSTLSTPFPPLDRLFNTTIEVLHFYCIE